MLTISNFHFFSVSRENANLNTEAGYNFTISPNRSIQLNGSHENKRVKNKKKTNDEQSILLIKYIYIATEMLIYTNHPVII